MSLYCSLLKGFSPVGSSAILRQVTLAMKAIADLGIVHRDLTLRNVLLFNFNPLDAESTLVKVANFRLAIQAGAKPHKNVSLYAAMPACRHASTHISLRAFRPSSLYAFCYACVPLCHFAFTPLCIHAFTLLCLHVFMPPCLNACMPLRMVSLWVHTLPVQPAARLVKAIDTVTNAVGVVRCALAGWQVGKCHPVYAIPSILMTPSSFQNNFHVFVFDCLDRLRSAPTALFGIRRQRLSTTTLSPSKATSIQWALSLWSL